jgi:hypothetical protein
METKGELSMSDKFESWLEGELADGYTRFGNRRLPAEAPYRSRERLRSTTLAAKVVVVFAAIVLALAATTVIAAAAATGSTNPVVWGQYMKNVVTTCKNQLQSGQHGIGNCVSAAARQKGAQEREQHGNGRGHGQTSPPQSASPTSTP